MTARAAAAAALAMVASASSWQPPSFCKTLDCPEFSVLASNASSGFELRYYSSAAWVSTNLTGASTDDYHNALQTGFMRLFNYISGANVPKAKVEMTAPVLTDVTPGEGPACNTTFTVSFFVPFADQAAPPQPSDPTVFISQRGAANVATLSFGGYANEFSLVAPQLVALNDILREHADYDPNRYLVAQYDSPFTVANRHNEVWYVLRS